MVADYIYGPQHAWILNCILESSLEAFTAYAVSNLIGSDKLDLVEFVLFDLVRVKLLLRDRSIFMLCRSGVVQKAIQRLPDTHLLRKKCGLRLAAENPRTQGKK